MSLKGFLTRLWIGNKVPVHREVIVDYKLLPDEVRKQLGQDALNVCVGILQDKLPNPGDLEALADWLTLGPEYPQPPQNIRLGWSEKVKAYVQGVRDLQKLFEDSKSEAEKQAKN